MDNFFDNLCRTLATPMPRARALKIIAGGLAGAVLSPLVFGQGGGNKKCATGQCACGTGSSSALGAVSGCCPPSYSCYSNKICCPSGQVGVTCGNGKNATLSCMTINASNSVPSGCSVLSSTGC